mgnify:CR=1 FL=1
MSTQDDRQQTGATNSALQAGTPAPPFTLPSAPDQKLSLSDFHGSPVISAFYPADWSPCAVIRWRYTTKCCRSFSAMELTCSVFPSMAAGAHAAYREHRNLHFSLLADFRAEGRSGKKYGCIATARA